MHIEIGDPLAQFVKPFGYHEKKVAEGSAEIIVDTSYEQGAEAKAAYYESVVELNPRVRTNKGFDIAVSFHPDEKLSNEEMQVLAMETARGLGYENTPIVVYRHHDKPHQHFHLLVTSVDFNGKKISERGNFIKAKKLAIELEKKYALRYTNRVKNRIEKDYQVENYSIAKAAQKHGNLPLEGLTVEEICNKSNSQIKYDYGEQVHDHLYKFFSEAGYTMKSEKQRLIEALQQAKNKATSVAQYEAELRKKGCYVRKLNSGHYVYKLEGGEFYFSTKKQLNTTFTHKGLSNYFGQPTSTRDTSKAYVERIIKKGLYKGKNINEFVAFCAERNVLTQFLTYNDGTAYGVNFVNAKTSKSYKGSELKLSYNELMSHFDKSFKPGRKFTPATELGKAAKMANRLSYELNKPDEENRKNLTDHVKVRNKRFD